MATVVHLIDGTYELYRGYFGAPPAAAHGRPVGAVRGLMRSLAAWLRSGEVTHAAIAFDHVIESFRNQLFAGYKTSEGVPADLMAQFQLAEDACRALGLVVWPMVEFEADDALATMAARLRGQPGVEVRITSPDKDMSQCVGGNVYTFDRHRQVVSDHAAVVAKFGVAPASIPDYLGLVGDDADGIPGLEGWGAKSAATVLARWLTVEAIPDDATAWEVKVRGADKLAATLRRDRELARLYKQLATLREDCPLTESLADLAWHGSGATLDEVCQRLAIDPPRLGA